LLTVLAPLLLSDGGGDLDLDFGAVINGVLLLLPSFASGARTNLTMLEASASYCIYHTTPEYGSRDTDARFPKLDTGDRGKLALTEALHKFTNFAAPQLPPNGAGGRMEGVLLLSGILGPDGFVPLGLSAGLDCTASGGACLE